MISTLIAELQLFLPVWVRARGIAIYLVTFTGSMTVGALIWGLVAEGVGLQLTFFTAAVVMFGGVVAGLIWRVPETGHLDREPAIYWPEARLAFDPEPDTGPVLVTVEYNVAPDQEGGFLGGDGPPATVSTPNRGDALGVYRDGDRPDRFIELFSVPSWEEHLASTRAV